MREYNILLLTVDCLRFDRISANGYEKSTTPNLDRFINQEGVNFTQAIAGGPSTMAAFPCLFTSSYPVMYGGTRYLSEERTTIAQVLAQEGYNTIGLSSNPYITPEFGYDRGFSSFWDSVKRVRSRDRKIELLNKVISKDSTLWSLLRKMARSGEIRQKKGLYPSASLMNKKILEAISKSDDNPFFIWAHYMDLHYPYNLGVLDLSSFLKYQPSPDDISDVLSMLMKEPQGFSKQERQLVNAIYDASLSYVDQQLGKLFYSLQELRVWDDLIIIATADHGEELLEKGRFGHGDEGQETQFSKELIHIPFILKMPNSSNAGEIVEALVSQVDVAPTLLDIVDIEEPNNWYGESVMPLFRGEVSTIREAAITQRGIQDSFSLSWRTADWQFIFNAYEDTKKLFRLIPGSSPQEVSLAAYSNIADSFGDQVLEHLRRYEKVYTRERLKGVELDEELKKQFEALGYL